MGKTKNVKEKKFDRNVEISAPILDPEVIKQIHSPPEDQRLDIRHGGFKALLSDLNSQDSTDEVTPITETNHLPSYIGISCAVSGYSSYSAYNKKPLGEDGKIEATKSAKILSSNRRVLSTPTRSQTNSPTSSRIDAHHINHITIDRSHINSAEEERKELTEKLTASASERRRSPSPLGPPEDDRHHGAYVGARYFPMPPPSKLVHRHIPLLGIDDDQDPDTVVIEDVHRVEDKIATLYGDDFVEDWKESMSHKSKREHTEEPYEGRKSTEALKTPKDLVSLRPAPSKTPVHEEPIESIIDVPTPNVKVLAGVEKQFLNRLLTDENPPMPKSPSPSPVSKRQILNESPIKEHNSQVQTTKKINPPGEVISSPPVTQERSSTPPARGSPASPDSQAKSRASIASPTPEPELKPQAKQEHEQEAAPVAEPCVSSQGHIGAFDSTDMVAEEKNVASPVQDEKQEELLQFTENTHEEHSASPHQPELQSLSSSSSDSQSLIKAQPDTSPQVESSVKHIEYEIRSESPVDNQSSPVKVVDQQTVQNIAKNETDNLVSFSPEPVNEEDLEIGSLEIPSNDVVDMMTSEPVAAEQTSSVGVDGSQGGQYYLSQLNQEISFINDLVKKAEGQMAEQECKMDEDELGKVRSAIGKANLLVNKKFNQFKELCERAINRGADEQFAVLNDDLAGFWDMLSIQIDDVKRSFESLKYPRD